MIHEKGNMWEAFNDTDYFLVTTNSTVRRDGRLVMGRGIAKKAKDLFKNLDKYAGDEVSKVCGSGGFYGVILGTKLGLFQVKYHWGNNADTELIRMSTDILRDIALKAPTKSFQLNYPGIGNGRLDFDTVQNIIRILPDNVHVWTYN